MPSVDTLQAGARSRAAAARVVQAVVRDGRSLDAALTKAEETVASEERGLLRAMCYGVLRYYWSLSASVAPLLKRPLRQRDAIVHGLLLVGLVQLTRMRVSQHAAVTLTVEAAKRLRRPMLAPLVNAILRAFLRGEAGDVPSDVPSVDLQARFDHPSWLIETLRADWPRHWRRILRENNEQAPMWLRVNARRGSVDAYLGRLEAGATTIAGCEQAVRLARPLPVDELPGFADGDVSVQDAAAQLAAPWLLASGGQRLLDVCAAPGGKAAHLLEIAPPGAALTAVEADPERGGLIGEGLARLGLEAEVRIADATRPADWWDGRPFDRVLLDAPCSASGVIRRHPDIKHLRRPGDIGALAGIQRRLLETAWQALTPGGRLLYVTCSVLADENERVIAGFLGQHADASETDVLPNNNIQVLMMRRPRGFQVLPGTQGLDGFYFACLDKRA